MNFEETTRKLVERECEDYFLGITDLSLSKNSVIKQFKSLIFEYPRAISIGITLPYKISGVIKNKSNILYQETNCKLSSITEQLSDLLERDGYRTLSIPKSRIEDKTFTSLHAIVANLALLGWIENGMLITPEVGSRVNWGTVLTDAPLKTRKKLQVNQKNI